MSIQTLIVDSVNNFSFITFLIVFSAAALLSFSSCTMIRIPIVLGYVTGISTSRKGAFLILLGFVSGLIISYTCLGVLLGIGAKFVRAAIDISVSFYMVSGIFLLFIGFFLLGLIPKLKSVNLQCVLDKPKFKKMNFFTALIFGIVFAFFEAPLCPCCGPILLIISTMVFVKGKIIYALLIFLTYAAGQSFPIFIIGLSAGAFKHAVRKTNFIDVYIKAISGTLLFCIGLYLVWVA